MLLTFGSLNLVRLYDELLLDGFHGVDLIISDVVYEIHLAVAASPNNLKDLEVRLCHFLPILSKVIYIGWHKSGVWRKLTLVAFLFLFKTLFG